MSSYTIIENKEIDNNVRFLRIDVDENCLVETLREVFVSLANLSWINNFDETYVKDSFSVRANNTVTYIAQNIIQENANSITSDSGEYVVSELSRKSIVSELNYKDIPLGELIKEQKSGNPGFDFYSENKTNILLFGEAKYLSNKNAYGNALKQIVRFEEEKRDKADLVDIDKFCSIESLDNISNNGKKGFIAAFASKKTKTDDLIKHIRKNDDYQKLKYFEELICVAVNV